MANADIRQLEMDGSVFYPQTDINGLVNNGEFAIDDEPIAGSDNLVESGGVLKYTNRNYVRQEDVFSDSDLKISDKLDNALVIFENGHIKTKNFDSAVVTDKFDKSIIAENGNSHSDLDIEDENGNKILRLKRGDIQTRNFDSSEISSNSIAQVVSSIGRGQMRVSYTNISSNDKIELTSFPKYIDSRKFLSFIGYMSEFPINSHFDFGFRYKVRDLYWHTGGWIRITPTNVEIYHDQSEDQSYLERSYTHNLTLSTFVKVFIYLREDYSLYIILETINAKYVIEYNRDDAEGKEIVGYPIFTNNGISFSDVQITAGSADFKSPIWIFGDSYSTASYGYSRLGQQLMDLGLAQNTCYDHLGGLNHQEAWDDLQLMLAFGTPRMIVWLLGVNGSLTNNVQITEQLKLLCDNKNIELVLEYSPLFPNSVGIDTTILRNKVLETGCRIVNFSRAVGCHTVGGDNVWYDGYLSGDKVHPTELGSRALVMQIINDIPELLQWGINEHPVYFSEEYN